MLVHLYPHRFSYVSFQNLTKKAVKILKTLTPSHTLFFCFIGGGGGALGGISYFLKNLNDRHGIKPFFLFSSI